MFSMYACLSFQAGDAPNDVNCAEVVQTPQPSACAPSAPTDGTKTSTSSPSPVVDIGANLTSGRLPGLKAMLSRADDAGVAEIMVTGTSVKVNKQAVCLHLQYNSFICWVSVFS